VRYKCLILDHDDTAVNSTAEIHYPAHQEVMQVLRPHLTPISLDGWFLKNFNPGIMEYLTQELGFDEEEIQIEYRIWRRHTTQRIPHFFPGFIEALTRYRELGGIIAVVSHSERDIIERHYRSGSGGLALLPDVIYGWNYDEEQRKPSPYPVNCILADFGVGEENALIVDDLKPGVLMARATGVAVAAAGWGHSIPEIREYMQKCCVEYLETVEQFREYILS
jgi:phosphoglycolate phosphatase